MGQIALYASATHQYSGFLSPNGVIVVLSCLWCPVLRFHPLSQYLVVPIGIDVIWGDDADTFVVASVVVVLDEDPDRLLQFTRHLVWNKIDTPLHGTVIALDFTVGLRMVRRGRDVADTSKAQTLTEVSEEMPMAIGRQ